MLPSGVAKPRMLGILAGMDQKDSCRGMCKAGIAGYNTPRAVLSFLVRRPMMFDIMAVLDQKDSCDISFAAQRQSLVVQTVRRTIDIPQLLCIFDVPVVRFHRSSSSMS